MVIASNRFKVLDGQTNVAAGAFTQITSSDLVSAAIREAAGTTPELLSMLSGTAAGLPAMPSLDSLPGLDALPAMPSLSDLPSLPSLPSLDMSGVNFPELPDMGLRSVGNSLSNMADVSGLSSLQLDRLAESVLPGATGIAKAAFRTVGGEGMGAMLGTAAGIPMGPSQITDDGFSCRLTQDPTTLNNYTGFVGKMTGGAYAPQFQNPSMTSRLITSVVSYGSQLGLPSAFSAIAANYAGNPGVQQAGYSLLRTAGQRGDNSLVMDIAASVVGPTLRAFNPDIANIAIAALSPPRNYGYQSHGDYYNTAAQTVNRYDPNWNTYNTGQNQMYSSRNIAPSSKGFISLLGANARTNTPVPRSNQGTIVDTGSSCYLYTATQVQPPKPLSPLQFIAKEFLKVPFSFNR